MAEYAYDGMNRRTVKKTYTAGSLTETRDFYYSDRWQVIEERVTISAVRKLERQFIWGVRYIDDLILRDVFDTTSGSLLNRRYACQDANYNVVAIADTSGSVTQRFSYDAYGVSTAQDAAFAPASNTEWETRYAGYRWDTETGLYQVRMRYLHSGLGRWIVRDYIDTERDNNLYAYALSDPISKFDPSGLKCVVCRWRRNTGTDTLTSLDANFVEGQTPHRNAATLYSQAVNRKLAQFHVRLPEPPEHLGLYNIDSTAFMLGNRPYGAGAFRLHAAPFSVTADVCETKPGDCLVTIDERRTSETWDFARQRWIYTPTGRPTDVNIVTRLKPIQAGSGRGGAVMIGDLQRSPVKGCNRRIVVFDIPHQISAVTDNRYSRIGAVQTITITDAISGSAYMQSLKFTITGDPQVPHDAAWNVQEGTSNHGAPNC